MSQPKDEKKPASKNPLPQNLAGKRAASAPGSQQFESMTDLSGDRSAGGGKQGSADFAAQNQTFEIFQDDEVLASKRTKINEVKENVTAALAQDNLVQSDWTEQGGAYQSKAQIYAQNQARAAYGQTAAVDQPPARTQEERYALGRELEQSCLSLIQDLSQNISLMTHLSEAQRRRELLLTIRGMVRDRDVEGQLAITTALVSAYYKDNRQGDFGGDQNQEPYGLFASDRYQLCVDKAAMQNNVPDKFCDLAPQFNMGFAVSSNFLLALAWRMECAAQKQPNRGAAELLSDLIKPASGATYSVTFPGALAPIKVEPLTQGEMAYGCADMSSPQFTYLGLLEKAYGQYLASTMEKDARPTLAADGAWAAHSPTKAHLGLRLLTGKTPRMLVAPGDLASRLKWKDTVAAALRECRASGNVAFAVRATDAPGAVLDAKAAHYQSNQLEHVMISFAQGAIELSHFSNLGLLKRTVVTFDQLFESALSFYAIVD